MPRAAVNLADDISGQIEDLIVRGVYAAGDQLKEAELSQRFEVGRSTVREALRRMETRGLVIIYPNRGAFVRALNIHEVLEIFDLRAEISAYSARVVTENLSPQLEAKLGSLISEMNEATNSLNNTYYKLNIEFHEAIVRGSRNHRAFEIYKTLIRESYLYRKSLLLTKAALVRSNCEHAAIVEAMSQGNAELAERLSRKHVLDGKLRFVNSFPTL